MSVSPECATPGATIRYTLDCQTPTSTNGEAYIAPIEIRTTTWTWSILPGFRRFSGGSGQAATKLAFHNWAADVARKTEV